MLRETLGLRRGFWEPGWEPVSGVGLSPPTALQKLLMTEGFNLRELKNHLGVIIKIQILGPYLQTFSKSFR